MILSEKFGGFTPTSIMPCIYILINLAGSRASPVISVIYVSQLCPVSSHGKNGGSLIFSKNDGSFLIFQFGFLDTRNERSL